MALHYEEYTTTPANWVADTKAAITTSTDWSNITANIVKATTTRGAEMVLDLNKAAPVNNYATIAFWHDHNGSSGNDEITRYHHWKYQSGGTTSNALHCVVSASKEHLIVMTEGPYSTESNTDNVESGSKRATICMADIVPYHGGDTTAAVVAISAVSTSQSSATGNPFCAVSADAPNSGRWVPAQLATVQPPFSPDMTSSYGTSTLQVTAEGDGKAYLFPFVVVETENGLRGRLNNVYWAGWSKPTSAAEGQGFTENSTVTYGGNTFVVRRAAKALTVSSSATITPFGAVPASSAFAAEPQIAVMKA
jgi:hypothetical protein